MLISLQSNHSLIAFLWWLFCFLYFCLHDNHQVLLSFFHIVPNIFFFFLITIRSCGWINLSHMKYSSMTSTKLSIYFLRESLSDVWFGWTNECNFTSDLFVFVHLDVIILIMTWVPSKANLIISLSNVSLLCFICACTYSILKLPKLNKCLFICQRTCK